MSTYSRCKICGFSTNGNFNKARRETKCETGRHIYEEFIFCPQCHSNTTKIDDGIDSAFCSEECQQKYSIKKPKSLSHCIVCGKISPSHRCRDCEDTALTQERKEQASAFQTQVTAFDEFKNCKYGVCDIVKAHHAVLKEDPQRLKSEFIIELVCGTEGKEFYLERRNMRH